MVALGLTESALASHSQEAKSDLVSVLSSLEAHWHVLEAEVIEINRDIDYCEQCLRKYGEWFNSPLQYLKVSLLSSHSRPTSSLLHQTCCPHPTLHMLPFVVHAGTQTHKEKQNVCGSAIGTHALGIYHATHKGAVA